MFFFSIAFIIFNFNLNTNFIDFLCDCNPLVKVAFDTAHSIASCLFCSSNSYPFLSNKFLFNI